MRIAVTLACGLILAGCGPKKPRAPEEPPAADTMTSTDTMSSAGTAPTGKPQP